MNRRSYAALLLIGGTALACRNEAHTSAPPGAAPPSASSASNVQAAATDGPGPSAASAALTAPASTTPGAAPASTTPGATPQATDYGALCSAFCSAAEAFHDGPPAACDGADPSCLESCIATGKTIDARCGAAYREMYECFISSNSWTCGGSPSTPTPASCAELQQRVEQCLSVEPG